LDIKKNGENAKKVILAQLKISAEKLKKDIHIEKANILHNISSVLKEFQDLKLDSTMKWNSNEENIETKIKYNLEKNEYLLKVKNPPIKYLRHWYSSPFQVKGDRPEDNQQLAKPIIFKSNIDDYEITVLIYNPPIKMNVNDWRILGLKQGESDEEFITFKIDEIQVKMLKK